jgi:phosphoribosylformylglycinamidine (FGAM) synthase-like amidotransferase family enzyme
MKLNKKLKDPNEKSAIQKFFGGKIPHYLAVVAFAYTIVNGGFSLLDWMGSGARQKAEEDRIERYIEDQVNEEIKLRFPDTTGLVLPKYMKKTNGSTNP